MRSKLTVRVTEIQKGVVYMRMTFKSKGTKHYGRLELLFGSGKTTANAYTHWPNDIAKEWGDFLHKLTDKQKEKIYNKGFSDYRTFLSEQTGIAKITKMVNDK